MVVVFPLSMKKNYHRYKIAFQIKIKFKTIGICKNHLYKHNYHNQNCN